MLLNQISKRSLFGLLLPSTKYMFICVYFDILRYLLVVGFITPTYFTNCSLKITKVVTDFALHQVSNNIATLRKHFESNHSDNFYAMIFEEVDIVRWYINHLILISKAHLAEMCALISVWWILSRVFNTKDDNTPMSGTWGYTYVVHASLYHIENCFWDKICKNAY